MRTPLYVRLLSQEEKGKLLTFLEHKDEKMRKRAKFILLSSEGHRMREISHMTNRHYNTVHKFIKRFNEEGVNGLFSRKPPGGEPKFNEEQKEKIVQIATSNLHDLGLKPSTRWIFSKMKNYLIEKGIVKSISRGSVSKILREKGIQWKSGYRFNEKQREKIVQIATSNPQDLGLKYTEWSLNKVRNYLVKKGIVEKIGRTSISVILREKGIQWKPGYRFNEKQKEKIVQIATSNPQDLGLKYTEWTLDKIKDYLVKEGIVEKISKTSISGILWKKGIRWKEVKKQPVGDKCEYNPKGKSYN